MVAGHHGRSGIKKKEGEEVAEPTPIAKLLAIGVGCMGLSFDDFCKLHPDEFSEMYEMWSKLREVDLQGAWERTRTLAAISISPHLKHPKTPMQLLPFPWDDKPKARAKSKHEAAIPEPQTPEEKRAYQRALINRYTQK